MLWWRLRDGLEQPTSYFSTRKALLLKVMYS